MSADVRPVTAPITIGNANLVRPKAGSTNFAAPPTTRPTTAPINMAWTIRGISRLLLRMPPDEPVGLIVLLMATIGP